MVKVILRIVMHSNFFHHMPRAHILHSSKRNNFFKAECSESVLQSSSCPFCSIALSPMTESKPPTNFNSRSEFIKRSGKIDIFQSDKTNKFACLNEGSSPESPPTSFDMI